MCCHPTANIVIYMTVGCEADPHTWEYANALSINEIAPGRRAKSQHNPTCKKWPEPWTKRTLSGVRHFFAYQNNKEQELPLNIRKNKTKLNWCG